MTPGTVGFSIFVSNRNKMHKLLFPCFFFLAGTLAAQSAVPFVLGVVDSVDSPTLKEKRRLNIYLPSGYSPDSAARYPVIYLLDGSADEDFVHVAGLVQFCNFPWIRSLPPAIVVGVSNVDRRRDFAFPTTVAKDKTDNPTSGHSAAFITFLEKELQPYLEKHYRVNGKKMLLGQSLGGLLATEILLKKPHLFTHYVIVSPSLWWDGQSLLTLHSHFPEPENGQKTAVYIAVGKEGKVMEKVARDLHKKLKKEPALQVSFRYFGRRKHADIYHEALYEAFERLGPSFGSSSGK